MLKEKLCLFLITVLALSFALSSAHAQQTATDKGKDGGTLRIAIPKDFRSLDGRYFSASGVNNRGQQQLYNRMVEFGPKGVQDIIPSLATDWKRIDDVTWLVHIRKGVKWHDGKEMTAEDLVKNYDWRINVTKYRKEKNWKPPQGTTTYIQFKNVEAVDKNTLKFTLKYPVGPFLELNLAWGVRSFIEPDVVEKYEQRATLHPVGTGPFKFVEAVSGSHVILERFEDYWGGKAYLDKVIIRIIPDAQTRLVALQIGEVDIATDLLLNQVHIIQKDPNLKFNLLNDPMSSTCGNLLFNFRRWPMNQLKFRQAVAMGADWRYFVRALFPKGAEATRYTLSERTWMENKEAKALVPTYNPKKARQLLNEVEKEAGKPIPRIYIMAEDGKQQIAEGVLQIAARELKKIGLNLDVRILDFDVYKDLCRRNPTSPWDIRIGDVNGAAFEPSKTITDFYSKTGGGGDGESMDAYKNPKLDELYLKLCAVYDKEERKKTFQEAEKILLKDLVVMPLFDVPYIFAYNKRVKDFPVHDSAHILLRTTWNNVWLEKK